MQLQMQLVTETVPFVIQKLLSTNSQSVSLKCKLVSETRERAFGLPHPFIPLWTAPGAVESTIYRWTLGTRAIRISAREVAIDRATTDRCKEFLESTFRDESSSQLGRRAQESIAVDLGCKYGFQRWL
uniref:Uncharacterized protein n=1 Tax=Steinernema glaseri TaxID=37863 RepID=A0A1I7YY17_9BILA